MAQKNLKYSKTDKQPPGRKARFAGKLKQVKKYVPVKKVQDFETHVETIFKKWDKEEK
jgi:hypothetical protein